MLKILHTSDWHLGKKLYKRERHEEHILFLEHLIKTLKDQEIDILIIAGDIFDSPTPPTKSLTLFYTFLGNLQKEVPNLSKVFAIGGNHDNGPLLEAPRPFLDETFFKIIGTYNNEDINTYREVFTSDDGESILIGTLPFFRPRELYSMDLNLEKSFETLQEELLYRLEKWCLQLRGKEKIPSFLIGHHLFGSYHLSGSELGVGLSGLDTIPLSLFENWDNLVLGHIHKPQLVKREKPTAIYSGSPIPLRFSEDNKKKMVIYTVDKELINYEWVDIPSFRPLIRAQFEIDQLDKELSKLEITGKLPPFLELHILKSPGLSNPKIEEIRLKVQEKGFELINLYSGHEDLEIEQGAQKEIQNLSLKELFSLYLQEYEIQEKERKQLKTAFDELQDIMENPNAPS